MTISNFLQFIVSHKLRIVSTIIVLIILSIGYIIFISYALVTVQVTGVKDNKSITVYTGTYKNGKSLGSPGLHIISRDTKYITVGDKSGHMQTHSYLDIPWYGFMTKTIALRNDKNAEKIAFRSSEAARCATYAQDIEQLLYYSCTNPRNLMRYLTPATGIWTEKSVVALSFKNEVAAPYLGGVIGITFAQNTDVSVPDITYFTSTGKLIGFNAPEETDYSLVANSVIFTDTDPNNNRFVFVGGDGSIFLATPSQNLKSVSYRKIDAPSKYSQSYNQTKCSLNDVIVHCFHGQRGLGDMPQSFDWSTVAKPSIVHASFENENIEYSDIDTPVSVVYNFYATDSDHLFLQNGNRLDYLKKSSSGYKLHEISKNVSSVSGGKDLLFVQNGGVFKLDLQTYDSYQIFYSSNVYATSTYQTNENTYVIGYASGDNSYTYAYRLLDQDNPGQRIIDKLPFKSENTVYVLTNDYVGDKVFVRIYTPYRPPASIGQMDPKSLMEIKDSIYSYLNFLNVNIKNIQLSL